jgi:hypothetical protein
MSKMLVLHLVSHASGELVEMLARNAHGAVSTSSTSRIDRSSKRPR